AVNSNRHHRSSVRVEKLATVTGPDRRYTAVCRDRPSLLIHVWKRPNVYLIPSILIGLVGEPMIVGRKLAVQFTRPCGDQRLRTAAHRQEPNVKSIDGIIILEKKEAAVR